MIPKNRKWSPLRRVDTDPGYASNKLLDRAIGAPPDEVWLSDRYQVIVRFVDAEDPDAVGRHGLVHLSVHAMDRSPVRSWRHMQQIKNEVMGAERVAVEIFPPESELVDTSNEYHLWVMPAKTQLPFGFKDRFVSTHEDVQTFNNEPHKGRQEPWLEGMTTGPQEGEKSMYERADELRRPADG